MRTSFAKALKKARKARGLTQEDFSLVTSRSHLSSLERGKKSPTLDKVAAIAGIIGLHPLTLFTLTCQYHDNEDDLDILFDKVKDEIPDPDRDNTMIRLFVTDDHAIVREGLKQLFALVDDFDVAGEAANGEETLTRLGSENIDLLLLDMSMPGLCGKDLIGEIRQHHPQLPILVLSMHLEPQIAQGALDAGANGYLTKDRDPETLLSAIRTVAGGGSYVDPRLSSEVSAGRLASP
jgi:CheY-like chemotaxis protein/DNA-binding XRE family transcriptional regulator